MTAVALGDSITAGDPWWAQANVVAGYPYDFTDAGVGGNKTADMLARLDADVLALSPSLVVVQGGGNDVAGDLSTATITANLAAIYDDLAAADVPFIATTICPTTSVASSASGSAAREAVYDEVNAWIRANFSSWDGASLCDWLPAIADVADPYIWKLGYDADGVHPSFTGSLAMASELAPLLG